MKATPIHAAVFLGVLLIMCASLGLSFATPVEAAVADWQKGGSIFPHWTGDFDTDSFRQSLRNLKATGANYAVLVIPIYQACDSCSDMYAGSDTPTDASLVSAVNYAHSIGMHVVLKPHLTSQAGSGWRATINASDRDAWFRNYGNYLNHLGDIGTQTGAEGITMGTELISMADYTVNANNTPRWNTMIANLRQHFGGYLTYSANWGWSLDSGNFVDEVGHVGFWPSLDYIGISAYYPQAQGQENPSVATMVANWKWWEDQQFKRLNTQYGKKILFTEIGYTSVHGAHNAPCCTWNNGYDATEQVNDYEALFQFGDAAPELAGIYLWNWDSNPDYGGQGNQDYTPVGKPALQTLTSWFSRGGGTTPPPPPPPGGGNPPPGSQVSGDWNVSATAPTLASGQASIISTTVAISDHANNVTVDLEIYDGSGTKIFQQFFTGQNISSSQSGHYDISWTPPGQGTYTLKAGVFNSDWTTNYYWNNGVIPLAVGQAGNGGPPSSGPMTTDIWWPADGASVSGVQPFKALVENKSLGSYTMYWRVDGDQLNQMYDSQQDAPHKEAMVDVGGWNWKGSGPYTITFVSKDSSGNTISEKSVNISIIHY